jgi:hypothetical protein
MQIFDFLLLLLFIEHLNNFECKLSIENYHMTVHYQLDNFCTEAIVGDNIEDKFGNHLFHIKDK